MSCNDISGINDTSLSGSCGASKSLAGIRTVWLLPFADVNEYVYTSDYLQKVTGFSTVSLPVVYNPVRTKSEYKGSKSLTDYRFYDHTLTLTFSKMEAFKREELMKLEHIDLTIIFEDSNGICWLMGQDLAAKLTNVSLGTGVKSGINDYQLTFTSKEKQHLREISCPSNECFTSFNGVEQRRSEIIVTDASLLTWQVFEAAADTLTLSYTSPSPLDPTNWGTPAILAADLAQLANLFNQTGTPLVPGSTLNGSYNGGTDEATITIDSPDTSYGAFKVDNVVFPGQVTVLLNLTAVLSPLVALPATTILVEDSVGTLYTGGYGTTIAAVPGVTGLTNDSIIEVTSLYPSGTTFTMSLPGLACSNLTYEYVFENTLTPCALSTGFEFFKGEACRINIPYVTGHVGAPRFQTMSINIFGDIFQLYDDYTLWHDDLAQFQNDLINIFNQVTTSIDVSSITFTDNTTDLDVSFNTVGIVPENSNPFFKTWVAGYDQPVFTNTGWIESRVLDLDTAGPYPSVITHTDEYSNVIKGENLVNISSNLTYDLGNTIYTSNVSIDNVGLVWGFDGTQPYNEQSTITTTSEGLDCLTPSILSVFEQCYTGRDSQTDSDYIVLSLDTTGGTEDLGKFFTFVTGTGTVLFKLPLSVTPNENMHFLTNSFNGQKGVQVIHMDYDSLDRTYFIHLKLSAVTIISFTETTNSRVFSLSVIAPIYTNTLLTKMNPYITMNYTCPTVIASVATGDKDLMQGEWQEKLTTQTAIDVDWDQAADTITLTKGVTSASTAATQYVITLHEDYPTDVNDFYTMTLLAGVASLVVPNIAADLITAGTTVALIKYVAYTDIFGRRYVFGIDLTIATDSVSYITGHRLPIMWGTMDNLEYIGTGVTVANPTVTSTTCVAACCAASIAPDITNITPTYTFNATNYQYDVNLEAIANIDCDIRYVQVTLTKQLGGDPNIISANPIECISSGCILGLWNFDSIAPFDFDADPTGKTYDVEYVFEDITHTTLYSFTATILL